MHHNTNDFIVDQYLYCNSIVINCAPGAYKNTVLYPNNTVVQVKEVAVGPHNVFPEIKCFMLRVKAVGKSVTTGISVPYNYSDYLNRLKILSAQAKNKSKSTTWNDFFNFKAHFSDLRPVYASTIHKSQGSQYKNGFINLTDIGRNPIRSDVARLMYVALTRVEETAYLYGNLGVAYNDPE